MPSQNMAPRECMFRGRSGLPERYRSSPGIKTQKSPLSRAHPHPSRNPIYVTEKLLERPHIRGVSIKSRKNVVPSQEETRGYWSNFQGNQQMSTLPAPSPSSHTPDWAHTECEGIKSINHSIYIPDAVGVLDGGQSPPFGRVLLSEGEYTARSGANTKHEER